MSTAILVTGGTGTLGRKLVRKLIAGGREVRVLSRKNRPGVDPASPKLPDWPDWFVGDLRTGVGLAKAVEGVGIIVHCASVPGHDVEAVAQLQIAAGRTGKPHIVYPSLIGADRIEHESYRDRRAIERLLADGELPWTVQRVSHFHEHLDAGLRRASRKPVIVVAADTSFQPIAANDVAERLLDLCTPMQAHLMADLAGPEVIDAGDLTAFWLTATGRKRKLVTVERRGKLWAGYREGWHLSPDRNLGQQTFAQYIADAYAEGARPDLVGAAYGAEPEPRAGVAFEPQAPAKADQPGKAPWERRFRRGRNEPVRETDDESAT